MTDSPIRELDSEHCWALLESAPIGRLALSVGADVDIFPITFVVHEGELYFRTAPGTKLLELSINEKVALEVDEFTDNEARSVVVKGHARRLEGQSEIDAADQLPLQPWAPTLKYRWVKITPETVTGREFTRGPEPERY